MGAKVFFRMVSFVWGHVPRCFFCTHRQRIRGCPDTDPFLAGDEQSHCGSRRRSRLVLPSQVSKLSLRCLRRSAMPPKVAATRRGRGSVAVGSTHPANVAAAKKKSASASGEVAAAPTCESPMCGAKSVASERIAAQLSPVARVPVAVSVIVPCGAEESPKDQPTRMLNLPPLWNAWYSTCCQVLHFVGDGGALVGKCALCGNGRPGRKDVMLDPEQLAELRTTPCLVYDPLTGSVSRPPSRVSAPPSYPRGQVRRSPQKFNELHMAKGCDLESEQLGEARSVGLSDEDSVSSHSSP
jgi:hypothetical protein